MNIQITNGINKLKIVFELDYEALREEAEAAHNEEELRDGGPIGRVMDMVYRWKIEGRTVDMSSAQYVHVLKLFADAGVEHFLMPWPEKRREEQARSPYFTFDKALELVREKHPDLSRQLRWQIAGDLERAYLTVHVSSGKSAETLLSEIMKNRG